MTRKEFQLLRLEIQKQKLVLKNDVDPFQYAVLRANFRKSQLRQLIALGTKVSDSLTVASQIKRWDSQVRRIDQSARRLQIHTAT